MGTLPTLRPVSADQQLNVRAELHQTTRMFFFVLPTQSPAIFDSETSSDLPFSHGVIVYTTGTDGDAASSELRFSHVNILLKYNRTKRRFREVIQA
jgi:hypothetical protein